MLQSWIESTVDFCIRYSRSVILAGLILAAASAVYAGRHFAINTDINDLLSARLPWRQHEIDFQRAFPQTVELIIADVRAPTPEAVKAAARELEIALADKPGLFHSVADQFDSPFFRRNGLLYLPPERIEHFTEPLAKAKPLVAGLVTDPSLRGLLRVLGQLLLSTQQDLLSFDDLQRPLSAAATTLEDLAKGEPAEFSWRILSQGDPKPLELHRFVQVWPVLDHNALEPGGRATAAIRDIVTQTGIEQKFGADVSLTGPVVISDNEFSGVHEGIVLNSVVTGAIILAILWLALRSLRLVAAAVINLTVGLLVTSAGGILMVGALNPISLAFAVLFVGLGADFAIQYTRACRLRRLGGYSAHARGRCCGGGLLVLHPHGLHWIGAAWHYCRLRHGGRVRDEPDLAPGAYSRRQSSARAEAA
jgi:predicted RND superfamily exporter protein